MSFFRTHIVMKFITFFVAAVIAFSGYTTFKVLSFAKLDNAEPGAQAIVVMGAAQYNGVPSPVLGARLDHAADLWKRHYAPVIVVTGGRMPGDKHTEAGASARYLASKGVPDSAVLREVQGRNSWQSLQASARFLHERGISKVILVSDPFHNARIWEMAKQLGLDAELSATQTSPIKGKTRFPYILREIAGLGFGKTIGFSRVAVVERNLGA